MICSHISFVVGCRFCGGSHCMCQRRSLSPDLFTVGPLMRYPMWLKWLAIRKCESGCLDIEKKLGVEGFKCCWQLIPFVWLAVVFMEIFEVSMEGYCTFLQFVKIGGWFFSDQSSRGCFPRCFHLGGCFPHCLHPRRWFHRGHLLDFPLLLLLLLRQKISSGDGGLPLLC